MHVARLNMARRREWMAGLCCALSGMCVLWGVFAGWQLMPVCTRFPSHATRTTPMRGMLAWDGEWYERIVREGYRYNPRTQSSVAFFPLYPAAAGALAHGIGMSPGTALLIVSNTAFLGACWLLAVLTGLRRARSSDAAHGSTGTGESDSWEAYALAALALFPATFYFRMAYSESLFLAIALGAFVAMERSASPWVVAALCGAATGTRAVGVALLAPYCMYLWSSRGHRRAFTAQLIVTAPVACWGLLAFAVYQWIVFGNPMAFIATQAAWNTRPWPAWWWWLLEIGTAEPLFCVFDPSSPCYWRRDPPDGFPLFNLTFMNPLFFIGAVTLVAVGAVKRWLTIPEIVYAAGALLIPYLAHSYPKCGASLARYTIVCFPIYLVLGRLLAGMGTVAAATTLALSASVLCIYSALFSSWYWFY